MTRPGRQRRLIPPPLTVAGVGEGHDHQLTRRWKIALALVVAMIVAVAVLACALFWYVLLSEDYQERQRQDIRDGICDVLEAFPPGPVLDDVRDRHGCGPGRPVDDFPPDVRDQITRSPSLPAAPEPAPAPQQAPAPQSPAPGLDTGAMPDPPRSEPYVPAPGETPAPPPSTPADEPGPVVDLSPVTELADDLLCPLICLESP